MDLMSKNALQGFATLRKRKAESSDNTKNNGVIGNAESNSSDEDSYKKPKEEIKTKISRVYVQIWIIFEQALFQVSFLSSFWYLWL